MLCKTVLSLKSPTGAFIATLHKRELLRIRHFRQLARKRKRNFGKKREDGRKKGFNYKKENPMK